MKVLDRLSACFVEKKAKKKIFFLDYPLQRYLKIL